MLYTFCPILSKKILNLLYKQRKLDKIIIGGNMSVSNLLNNKEGYLKEALEQGIDADTVNSTLGDMISKSNEKGSTPKQAMEVVESIVEMKKSTENIIDESYASNFVKENNAKIKSAINNGISSDEITRALVTSAKNAKDKKAKRHFKFITKLITKMKVKELNKKQKMENTLEENQMEKDRQNVFFK